MVAGPLAVAVARGSKGRRRGPPWAAWRWRLVGWGVPKDRSLKYETQIEGGKFLVLVRGEPEVIPRARSLLAPETPEHMEIYKQ